MSARPLAFQARPSMPLRLALAAAIFVAAIATVHVLSLDRLFRIDRASSEVGGRSIGSLQVLGRLTDAVSDVWAGEAGLLLSRDDATRAARAARITALAGEAGAEIDAFRAIRHDPDMTTLFEKFSREWAAHLAEVRRVTTFAGAGDHEAALAAFESSGRSSYEAADATLHHVVSLAEANAKASHARATAAIADARGWISDLTIAILVLFLALGAYLWWAVSRPLLILGGVVRRLALQEAGACVPYAERRDEIGELARAVAVLRRNAVELIESRKSLANQNEVLSRSLDKERALAAEQRNFIGTISHELRTPLMALDGHAQRLIATAGRAGPPDLVERGQRIRSAAMRMTNLLVSLTAALDRGRQEPQARMRDVDLKAMLEDLARYYSDLGESGGLEVGADYLPPTIRGDPELLYQAFSNLVANAIRYTADGSPVRIEAVGDGARVAVAVEDKGLGIPRREIERVRERYFRASNVGSIPGTGMGLHLVDTIVRQHGGRLMIESVEGVGTRATVDLPVDGRGWTGDGLV